MTLTNSNSTKRSSSQRTKRRSDHKRPNSRLKHKNSNSETVQRRRPSSARDEIEAGVELITDFIRKQNSKIPWARFSDSLTDCLREKFKGHWYPDSPVKGSGFRCIRLNQYHADSLVDKVAKECGIESVRENLPQELTVWIDPGEVSYRIGEEGSICVYYDKESAHGKSGCKTNLKIRSESVSSG